MKLFPPNPKPVTTLFDAHLELLVDPPKPGTNEFKDRKATFFAACIAMLEHLKISFPVVKQNPSAKEKRIYMQALQKIHEDCVKELEGLVASVNE